MCQTAHAMVKGPLAPFVQGWDLRPYALWKSNNPDDKDQVEEQVLQLMKDVFGILDLSSISDCAMSILTNVRDGFRKAGNH